MLQTILYYKWQLLFISELLGWAVTVLLIFARYYIQSKSLFYFSFIIIVLVDYVPSITLPIIDAMYTDNLQTWLYKGGLIFNLTVIGLFFLSITLGKKYLIIIDQKIFDLINLKKNQSFDKQS